MGMRFGGLWLLTLLLFFTSLLLHVSSDDFSTVAQIFTVKFVHDQLDHDGFPLEENVLRLQL